MLQVITMENKFCYSIVIFRVCSDKEAEMKIRVRLIQFQFYIKVLFFIALLGGSIINSPVLALSNRVICVTFEKKQ